MLFIPHQVLLLPLLAIPNRLKFIFISISDESLVMPMKDAFKIQENHTKKFK